MKSDHYAKNDSFIVGALASGKYLVTPDGDVWNLNNRGTGSPKKIKKRVNEFGYLVVAVEYNGIRKGVLVHRLVLITYIGVNEEKKVANHIDGDKKNNLINNLEWLTQSENVHHAWRTGLRGRFRNAHNHQFVSQLTSSEVIQIHELRKGGETYGSIAARFSITKSAVYRIVKGLSHRKIFLEFKT